MVWGSVWLSLLKKSASLFGSPDSTSVSSWASSSSIIHSQIRLVTWVYHSVCSFLLGELDGPPRAGAIPEPVYRAESRPIAVAVSVWRRHRRHSRRRHSQRCHLCRALAWFLNYDDHIKNDSVMYQVISIHHIRVCGTVHLCLASPYLISPWDQKFFSLKKDIMMISLEISKKKIRISSHYTVCTKRTCKRFIKHGKVPCSRRTYFTSFRSRCRQ